MTDAPQRLPYEPMDERQRAIDMVREIEVTKHGDVFDLIARLLRDVDRYAYLCEFREWPDEVDVAIDCGGKNVIDAAIDAARKADA